MSEKEMFPVLGDAVKWMVDSKHCLDSVTLVTGNGMEPDIASGLMQPLLASGDNLTFCAAANIANATDFLFEQGPIAMEEESSKRNTRVLARGPATVNADALPATDY